jgi:hypothetical protein
VNNFYLFILCFAVEPKVIYKAELSNQVFLSTTGFFIDPVTRVAFRYTLSTFTYEA